MIDMTGHDLPQHVQALEAAKRGDPAVNGQPACRTLDA
jgi:hypothetical protein